VLIRKPTSWGRKRKSDPISFYILTCLTQEPHAFLFQSASSQGLICLSSYNPACFSRLLPHLPVLWSSLGVVFRLLSIKATSSNYAAVMIQSGFLISASLISSPAFSVSVLGIKGVLTQLLVVVATHVMLSWGPIVPKNYLGHRSEVEPYFNPQRCKKKKNQCRHCFEIIIDGFIKWSIKMSGCIAGQIRLML